MLASWKEWLWTLTTADTGRVKLARRCVLLRGNFKTAASLASGKRQYCICFVVSETKVSRHYQRGNRIENYPFYRRSGGCLGLDRFAGNLQMAINNCKVLTLTGHGRGLFASGEKAAVKWQSQTSTPLQLNTTSGLLQKVRGPWRHGMWSSKTVCKTGQIFGPKKNCSAKTLKNQATDYVWEKIVEPESFHPCSSLAFKVTRANLLGLAPSGDVLNEWICKNVLLWPLTIICCATIFI